jgi:hypothetical protein
MTVAAGQIGSIASTTASATAALGVLNDVSWTVASWVRQAGCALTGHDMIRHFEPRRVSLECMHCGVRTAGWNLQAEPATTAPSVGYRLPADAANHAMA